MFKGAAYASGPYGASWVAEWKVLFNKLYWNPHFYQHVEDQGQTQTRSSCTRASNEAISHVWFHIGKTRSTDVCVHRGPARYVELQEVDLTETLLPLVSCLLLSVYFLEVYKALPCFQSPMGVPKTRTLSFNSSWLCVKTPPRIIAFMWECCRDAGSHSDHTDWRWWWIKSSGDDKT